MSYVPAQPLSPETLCEDSSSRAIVLANQEVDETSNILEDCVNDLSRDTLVMIEPKVILHPQPCFLSRIESRSLFIVEECFIPFQSIRFQDPFWKNFIRRDDRIIILSQPWLYDSNPTVRGTFHSPYFEFKDCQVRSHPREPKVKKSN